MSNTPQPPADGWQPPQSPQEPPVYRPNEQPPAEEPPPWSPESQRVDTAGQRRQQVPVEDLDGTVKYSAGQNSEPQAPFGPPPGVPVSPFDSPVQQPGLQGQGPVSATPYQQSGPPYQGGGYPYQAGGSPYAPGMPPVSSVPSSGMPVSPGQGQFGPQGGQLVPMSGVPGQGQPWGAPEPIQRKKKGGKGPLWILLAGIVVIAAALGVGGFILFNPASGGTDEEKPSATIENQPDAEPVLVSAADDGLKFVLPDGSGWSEAAEAPAAFSEFGGVTTEDGSGQAYVGPLDAGELQLEADTEFSAAATAFGTALAAHLGGEAQGEPSTQSYWIDGRQAQFIDFTVGDTDVYAVIVQTDGGFEGFAGFGSGDMAEQVAALRTSIRFGEL